MAGTLTAAIAAAFAGGVTTDPYYEYTTLLLPGNGTNGAQNNTFLDGSTNNFTITRNGNTTQGTFSPFSQTGWGNYFNGSTAYLSIANDTSLQLSGDFTIDLCVYLTASTGFNQVLLAKWSSTSQGYIIFYDNVTQKINFYNSVTSIASSSTVSLNTWIKITVTRSGNNYTLYIDGSSVGTSTTASTATDSGGEVNIGRNTVGNTNYTLGYISNLRIIKGSVVTPAAGGPTSPFATGTTNQVLLTCQANRFVDSNTATTAKTITPNGSPTVVAFSPFNPTASWSATTYGGSGYFDGSGDYLTAPNNTALDLSTGDFTVECWFYPTTWSTGVPIIYRYNGNYATGADFQFTIYTNSSGAVSVRPYQSTTDFTINAGTAVLNAWNHVALVRTGNTFWGFLNGNRSASSQTITGALNNSTWSTFVGAALSTTLGNTYFYGYITDTRVLKGTALYTTSTYTVPTAPLTAITNTSLLLNFTNAGIYDATSKNDLETVGNAQISTTQSKWGGSSMSFDGNNDSLNGPSSTELDMGTGNWTVEGWINITTRTLNYPLIIGNNNGGFSAGAVAFTASNADSVTYNDRFNLAVYDLGGTRVINATGTANATGTWYHFAVVRNGTNISIYRDGVSVASATVSSSLTINFGKNGVRIGGNNWDGAQSYLNGYLQDLRITKGYARYTANFTPPTAAFPTL